MHWAFIPCTCCTSCLFSSAIFVDDASSSWICCICSLILWDFDLPSSWRVWTCAFSVFVSCLEASSCSPWDESWDFRLVRVACKSVYVWGCAKNRTRSCIWYSSNYAQHSMEQIEMVLGTRTYIRTHRGTWYTYKYVPFVPHSVFAAMSTSAVHSLTLTAVLPSQHP